MGSIRQILPTVGSGFRLVSTVGVVLVVLVSASTGAVAISDEGAVADRGDEPLAADSAPLTGENDLSAANTTIAGVENDSLGKSVVPAGDVNGDGHADLLIGAPFNDSAGPGTGAVYLFYGPVTASSVSAADADLVLYGESSGDWAGWSVAAGDLNDDGYSDVVVGAPLNDRNDRGSGAIYVLYGDEDRSGAVKLSDADDILVGETPRDNAGHSVAVGDVTGDSAQELVVGAPRSNASESRAGAVYVLDQDSLSGPTDSTAQSLSVADVRFTGESTGDLAGSSVAPAGDFDGDGTPDLVIGARDAGPDEAGAAYVVTRTNATGSRTLGDATLRLDGVAAGDHAGWAVAGAGDTNDDGNDDVIIGAPTNDEAGNNAGAAYVIHGSASRSGTMSLGDADQALLGAAAGDRAGWSVAAAGSGDVTCDGFDDVLVGAPRNDAGGTDAGAAYLVAGESSPDSSRSLSTANGTFVGTTDGSLAGWAVAGGTDVNGDGPEDVFVGAPRNGDAAHHAGAAYLIAGSCEEDASDDGMDGDDGTGGTDGDSGDDDSDADDDETAEEPDVGVERVTVCVVPGVDEDITPASFAVEPAAVSENGTPTAVQWGFTTGDSDLDQTRSLVVERTDGTFEVFEGGHNGTIVVGDGTVTANRTSAWPCEPVSEGELVFESYVWNGSAFEDTIGTTPPPMNATIVDGDVISVTVEDPDYPYWMEVSLVNRSNPDQIEGTSFGDAERRLTPPPGHTGNATVTVEDLGYDRDVWIVQSVSVWSGYDWVDWLQYDPIASDELTDAELDALVNDSATASSSMEASSSSAQSTDATTTVGPSENGTSEAGATEQTATSMDTTTDDNGSVGESSETDGTANENTTASAPDSASLDPLVGVPVGLGIAISAVVLFRKFW